jgi:hypothetical protein
VKTSDPPPSPSKKLNDPSSDPPSEPLPGNHERAAEWEARQSHEDFSLEPAAQDKRRTRRRVTCLYKTSAEGDDERGGSRIPMSAERSPQVRLQPRLLWRLRCGLHGLPTPCQSLSSVPIRTSSLGLQPTH